MRIRILIQPLIIPIALALSACGQSTQQVQRQVAPPVRQLPAAAKPVRFSDHPLAPINRNISNGEALWHVRAGLNVAALSCRGQGRTAVAPAYNRLVTAQRTAFETAQHQEEAVFKSSGVNWQRTFDQHQTRLYNFFANPKAVPQLCRSAATIAQTFAAMSPGELASNAMRALAELESSVI